MKTPAVIVAGLCAALAVLTVITSTDESTSQPAVSQAALVGTTTNLDSLAALSDESRVESGSSQNQKYEAGDMLLRLIGTIVNESQASSLALIADAGMPQGAYYETGETLPDGSFLVAVYENEAHLSLDGELRILYSEGIDGKAEAASPAVAGDTPGRYRGSYDDALFNDQTMSD